jgi:hypothetical protein
MKLASLLCTFFLLFHSSSFSQTCLSGNCSSGYGKFQYANGDIYEGEFYDDKREGFGIYKWKTGDKYMGESLANQFSGFGVMTFKDGTKYIGDFKNGEFAGEGEKTFPNGDVQKGLFEKGSYKGKISYYGKAVGTAGCLNGDCNDGYGMKYYTFHDRYFGYFKNEKREGYGSYYWDDGTRWVGQFSQNQLTGYGTYFFITGEKYVGYFINSKRNGWGVNYDPGTGVKKIGFWENDQLVTPKSSLIKEGNATGCISGDCKNGAGKYVYNNGYYEGSFKNGYRNGRGKYFFDIGDFYEGNFRDNKFHGKGTYYYTNGERYDGEWKEQRYHGKGQLFHFDGLPEDGFWNQGKFEGKNTPPPGYEAWVKNNYDGGTGSTAVVKPPVNNNQNNNNTAANNNNPKPNNNTNPTTPKTNNNQTANTGFSLVDKEIVKKGLALVIGNSKYKYFNVLNNPQNDAKAISATLKANGFDVILLYDGDRDQMIEKFNEFKEKLQGYEIGLFYYSGHGVKNGSENYMVPVNVSLKSPDDVNLNCLGLSNILSRMGKAFTKLNLVIMDACRTPFKEGKGSSDEFDPQPNLSSKALPDETGIYFATSDGTPASDGVPGTNGVYTGELVKYLKYMCQPDVNLETIFKRVSREVKSKSQKVQVPEATSNITKDFYYQCKQ